MSCIKITHAGDKTKYSFACVIAYNYDGFVFHEVCIIYIYIYIYIVWALYGHCMGIEYFI